MLVGHVEASASMTMMKSGFFFSFLFFFPSKFRQAVMRWKDMLPCGGLKKDTALRGLWTRGWGTMGRRRRFLIADIVVMTKWNYSVRHFLPGLKLEVCCCVIPSSSMCGLQKFQEIDADPALTMKEEN